MKKDAMPVSLCCAAQDEAPHFLVTHDGNGSAWRGGVHACYELHAHASSSRGASQPNVTLPAFLNTN
jgi:hypothetical protein